MLTVMLACLRLCAEYLCVFASTGSFSGLAVVYSLFGYWRKAERYWHQRTGKTVWQVTPGGETVVEFPGAPTLALPLADSGGHHCQCQCQCSTAAHRVTGKDAYRDNTGRTLVHSATGDDVQVMELSSAV